MKPQGFILNEKHTAHTLKHIPLTSKYKGGCTYTCSKHKGVPTTNTREAAPVPTTDSREATPVHTADSREAAPVHTPNNNQRKRTVLVGHPQESGSLKSPTSDARRRQPKNIHSKSKRPLPQKIQRGRRLERDQR